MKLMRATIVAGMATAAVSGLASPAWAAPVASSVTEDQCADGDGRIQRAEDGVGTCVGGTYDGTLIEDIGTSTYDDDEITSTDDDRTSRYDDDDDSTSRSDDDGGRYADDDDSTSRDDDSTSRSDDGRRYADADADDDDDDAERGSGYTGRRYLGAA